MAKQTMVSAQILTIEDTIAGNLTMKQLALIGVSVLGSGSIYFLIEPANKVSLLKFLLLAAFNAVVLGSASASNACKPRQAAGFLLWIEPALISLRPVGRANLAVEADSG